MLKKSKAPTVNKLKRYFHHWKALNTSFIQPDKSTWTILSDNQIARTVEYTMKAEPLVEEARLNQNHTFGTLM